MGKWVFLGTGRLRWFAQSRRPGLTLVTYDQRTIPPLLKIWTEEEERTHGGVVFVDEKTISPADIGGLIWALSRLARKTRKSDWTNRIYCLRRGFNRLSESANCIVSDHHPVYHSSLLAGEPKNARHPCATASGYILNLPPVPGQTCA